MLLSSYCNDYVWPKFHKNNAAELQWLERIWYRENMFETGVVRANKCYSQSKGSRRHNSVDFSSFFDIRV